MPDPGGFDFRRVGTWPEYADLARAIDSAVERAGGDGGDARDLAEVWERATRDCERRAGGIRATVRAHRCSCADGGHAGADGRCERCIGRLRDGGSR